MYVNYTTSTSVCLDDKMILSWQPGAVTVYALPVIEIEMIVGKLTALLPSASSTDAGKLVKLIGNWNSVLSNYRSHNSNLTSMFSDETLQFISVVNRFKAFKNGQLDAQDFASAVANTLDGRIDFTYLGTILYALNGAFSQIQETCDQVLPYSVSMTIAGATEDTGGAGSYLQAVCDDFDSNAWESFATMINGACSGISADGEPQNPLSSTPMFVKLCAAETLTDDSVPGGVQSSSGPVSLLSFLNDNKKFMTFSAKSPVELSWTSAVTESRTFNVEYEYSRTLTADSDIAGELEIFGIGVDSETNFGLTNTFAISLGKSSEEDHETERTVTVTLDDEDNGDFFAVRITEDPVFGTPVFTTMGGASKCPGETGTSRRESNVRILQIRERCGADKASPCNELTLGPGDNANFGVIIENLSPTQDEVYYTLVVASAYDNYLQSGGDGNYTCGVSGQGSGLVVILSGTDIQRIPYNTLVEVPFTVTHVYNGPISLCDEFNDIELKLIATCEQPSSSSAVYQYGVTFDEVSKQTVIDYDPANRIYASNSTATFSVKWPAARRRLSDAAASGLSHADGYDAADAMTDILLRKIEENKNSMVMMEGNIRALIIGIIGFNSVCFVAIILWIFCVRSKWV